MAGPDEGDWDSLPTPKGWDVRPGGGLRGLRIGLPKQLEAVACEAAVLAGLGRARAALEDAGARVR
jgi:aspartyl-tRNA(Asn)/glutamyl-tRNA(Gln) amidotransferase subunit A